MGCKAVIPIAALNNQPLNRFTLRGWTRYAYPAALLEALPKARKVEDYEALLPWRIELSRR